MGRYIIHVDRAVTWVLVHDEAVGRWHVNRRETQAQPQAKARGNRTAPAKLTFDAFDQGDQGERLTAQFVAAVRAAEQDV